MKPNDAKSKRTLLPMILAFAAGVAVTAWYFSGRDAPNEGPSPAKGTGLIAKTPPSETGDLGYDGEASPRRRLTGRTWPKLPERPRADPAPKEEAEESAKPSDTLDQPVKPQPAADPLKEKAASIESTSDQQLVSLDGAIRGVATRGDAEVPSEAPINATTDPKCAQLMGGNPVTNRYRIRNGRVADVFVYVTNPPRPGSYRAPKDPVTLDQKACRYAPRVFGIFKRQQLDILNSDQTLHNVHAFATRGEFNQAMPRQGQRIRKKFKSLEPSKGGVIQPVSIRCDVHPWMSAHAFVMDHPFFAVTDEDGNFAITGLPDGTYRVAAWHAGFASGPWQFGTAKVSSGLATHNIDLSGAKYIGDETTQRPMELLKKMRARYDGVDEYSADFVQDFTRIALGRTTRSTGTLHMKKPNMMRWEYTKPDNKLFVVSGRRLWVYQPDEEQVLVDSNFDLENLGRSVLFLWGTRPIENDYIVTAGDPTDFGLSDRREVLVLQPRSATTYAKIVLGIDPTTHYVSDSIIFENSGNTNRFHFKNVRVDEGLDLALFQFEPPPGVDIIRQ